MSVALAATALWAAVVGVDALLSWRFEAQAAGLQERYGDVERALVNERRVLSSRRNTSPADGTARAAVTASASRAALALAELADAAPVDTRPRLRRLGMTHRAATRAAARGVSLSFADRDRRHELAQATQLLRQVSSSVAALAAANRRDVSASSPRRATDYLAVAAIALAAFVGILVMFRRAIITVTRSGGPGGPTDPELARLVSETRTDSLTKLSNHRAFHEDLAREIDRRNTTGSLFTLMALDLDGLKAINDTLGHQAGDAHIMRIAQALQDQVGVTGSVYRTGGDEFMILLPNCRNWHAINLAHRIHAATVSAAGARTLSIGISETTGTEHRHVLVRQADVALYEAKRARLAVVAYQPGLERAEPDTGDEGAVSAHLKALAAALARTVDARDLGTSNHSEMVAELAAGIAARHGIVGRRLERLRIAALLHDVGKIAVSDAILHKPAALARAEQKQMREHVSVGRDILVAAGFTEEAAWVLHHHEHFDGTGYPDSLTGDAIPLESRIIAVADAFEAMTGARPYRKTLTNEEALAELTRLAGTQFDASCVRAVADVVNGAEPPAPSAAPAATPKRRGARQTARDPHGARPISQLKSQPAVP